VINKLLEDLFFVYCAYITVILCNIYYLLKSLKIYIYAKDLILLKRWEKYECIILNFFYLLSLTLLNTVPIIQNFQISNNLKYQLNMILVQKILWVSLIQIIIHHYLARNFHRFLYFSRFLTRVRLFSVLPNLFVVEVDLDALKIYYVRHILLSTTIISDLSGPVLRQKHIILLFSIRSIYYPTFSGLK